jgi:ATP-binding cassette subfamily B protein
MLAALALVTAWTVTVLSGPLLVRYAIDQGIKKGQPRALDRAVALYIALALVSYGLHRAQIWTLSVVGETFLRDLRVRVFDHLQRLAMPFYDREKAGVLVSRMTSDIDSLQELVQLGLLTLLSNTLLLLLSVVVLSVVSIRLMLVCAVVLPFVVVATRWFQRESRRAYLEVRDRIGHTLSLLQEGIAGVRVIQAFAREEVELERFARGNRALYGAHMQSVRLQAWYLPVIEFAGVGTTAAVLTAGGWMVTRGLVTIGTVAFFVLTLSHLFEPVQLLSQLFTQMQSASAGLTKVLGLLDTKIDTDERADAVDLPARGTLELHDASFAYRDGASRALTKVSLRVAPGETLALVGPTGAGKSTLAKLAARLYDPVEGSVTFAGIDLRDARAASLHTRIVLVPQEGFLFNTSIRENVRIARPEATDDDVARSLESVGALERFEALPEGLDTEVSERGSRLSAGERQLVSLGRAALVDPALLVLDEATSSLDPATESLVQEAMQRIMKGRTVIVVAHRLKTAEQADRIGVVCNGTLAELGTHVELIARDGMYAQLHAEWSRRREGQSFVGASSAMSRLLS